MFRRRKLLLGELTCYEGIFSSLFLFHDASQLKKPTLFHFHVIPTWL